MRKIGLFGCFALLLMVPATSQAQISFGPQVSWATEIEEIAVGARLQAGLPAMLSGLQLIGSADYYFVNCDELGQDVDCSTVDLNANAALPILPLPMLNVYVGAGVNYLLNSIDDVDANSMGINVLAGVKFPGTTIRPFAEARYTFAGDDDPFIFDNRFTITAGLLFGPR